MTVEELAKSAFEAYNEHAGGRTWDDRPIPSWDEVGDKVRGNWIAAANNVLNNAHKLDKPIDFSGAVAK